MPVPFHVVRELAPRFGQTVRLGDSPIVKDIIDARRSTKIAACACVTLILAGDVFSEEWRDLVGKRPGILTPRHGSDALDGTANAGVLGTETPLSMAIGRFPRGTPETARILFGSMRLPILVS